MPVSLLLCLFVFSWSSSSFAEEENPFAVPRTYEIDHHLQNYRSQENLFIFMTFGEAFFVPGMAFISILHASSDGPNLLGTAMGPMLAIPLITANLVKANALLQMRRSRRRLEELSRSDFSQAELEPVQEFLRGSPPRSLCSRVTDTVAKSLVTVGSAGLIAGTAWGWRKEIEDSWDQAKYGFDEVLWKLQNR